MLLARTASDSSPAPPQTRPPPVVDDHNGCANGADTFEKFVHGHLKAERVVEITVEKVTKNQLIPLDPSKRINLFSAHKGISKAAPQTVSVLVAKRSKSPG
jgi:hypothetical protein